MAIETIRLSEKEKQQLITLKRRTGVDNWNVLARWAFCLSLAEHTIPPLEVIPSNSSVEMSWKTFGGAMSDVLLALLRERAKTDGFPLDKTNELEYFRSHLHRGISFMITATDQGDTRTFLSLIYVQQRY